MPHLLGRFEAVCEDSSGILVFWQIELFCKAVKQNLKIKTFVGPPVNAVKTQIWTALRYLQLPSRFGWGLCGKA